MHVEAAKIILRLPHTTSLKDKRSVLKKLMARVQRHFPAAIAEVDQMDDFRRAVVGIALVSNNSLVTNGALQKIIELLESDHEVELEDSSRDVIRL